MWTYPAVTGDKASIAHQWVKKRLNVNEKLAKSLAYIHSGHSSMSFTKLIKNNTNKISVNIMAHVSIIPFPEGIIL